MTSLTSTEMSLEAGVPRVSRPAFQWNKSAGGAGLRMRDGDFIVTRCVNTAGTRFTGENRFSLSRFLPLTRSAGEGAAMGASASSAAYDQWTEPSYEVKVRGT